MRIGLLLPTRLCSVAREPLEQSRAHEGMKRVQAPHVLLSKAGAKRAGLAHADCIWIGFFPNPNNDTDPFRMEDAIVEQPFTIKGGDVSCLE